MKTKKTKEIEVMGKYKLSADSLNVILQEKHHNKKQNMDSWLNIAYFSTPKNALDYVIEKEIRESWVDDLKEVVKGIDKLYKAIKELNGNHYQKS